MSQWFTDLQSYIETSHQDWSGSVLFITLASFIAWIAWRLIRSRLAVLVEKTPFHWDDMLLDALKAPVSTLIWCWPATVSIGIILESELNDKINWLSTLKLILVISIFVWTVMRLITNVEEYVLEQKNRDETTVQAIAKVARLFFITVGILTVMQAFGLSLSGLLTFGGVGGLIVGLAAKDLLSNFFGGLMIYFDRPFKVGDWIRSPDRQIEGTVERIGWRMTIIRTFDKRPLYVPNIYTFTKTVNWVRYHEVKQDVLLQVINIIKEHEADIAFPTQTLKLDPVQMIKAEEQEDHGF
ncbi:mechanosensitive ion channel family protein [Vibrio diabolicus]|uniref:mechanosensitive ion channel family protein n=1 Tax=Vibrio diabolicus TaxID=50719 RepID=UPI00373EC119